MDSQRLKKIENTAKKIMSTALVEELTAEDVKLFRLVNIAWVKLSSDVSYLDVYVSAFENGDKLTKALALYADTLERKLFKELAIRRSPKIRFRYDDSGAVSSHILEKINEL